MRFKPPLLPLLALLALPAAAAAQPWAPEPARAAGRQAIAAANNNRWPEADSFAAAADPLARKLVTWLRLTARNAPASGAELARFIDENPDWPFPDSLMRRAEEVIAIGGMEDADILRLYARNHPRGLPAAMALADALTRAGRAADTTPMLRRTWAEGAADSFAEDAFLSRYAAILTQEDAWRRFDRLSFGRDPAGAARAAQRLTGARRA
ncbi:lytic transglycosylase domain-containing protein, partial [Roseomonas hellenica]|nr:lytic transglycosylase domain-containing protein [Plastoroseomonas hellenica]